MHFPEWPSPRPLTSSRSWSEGRVAPELASQAFDNPSMQQSPLTCVSESDSLEISSVRDWRHRSVMRVGNVAELWRYPVKSMRGERLQELQVLHTYGVPGDRGWALRDEEAGEIRGAKKITKLVQFAARYLAEPEGASTPPVEITFPDGVTVTSDDPGVEAALSVALDRQVTLWPRQPADALDHYRRVGTIDEADMRAQLALLPDDALPDYRSVPEEVTSELQTYVAPPGTYFDAFPLSLLTTSSMSALGIASPGSVIDTRRFRQNVIVDSTDHRQGFIEPRWIGRELRVGSLRTTVVCPISRCVMVTLPQADLPRDRSLMRTLVRETGMDLGVYLRIIEPGEVHVGDSVEVL